VPENQGQTQGGQTARRPDSRVDLVMAALPYALPVLGGLIGVIWVNLNKMDFLNPFVAVVIGVVIGRLVAWVITKLFGQKGRRRQGRR